MSFKSILAFVLGVTIGAVIELVLTILFEDTARRWWGRTVRFLRFFFSRITAKVHPLGRDLFQIGGWTTNCIILEGYGERYYSANSIVCQLDADSLLFGGMK